VGPVLSDVIVELFNALVVVNTGVVVDVEFDSFVPMGVSVNAENKKTNDFSSSTNWHNCNSFVRRSS